MTPAQNSKYFRTWGNVCRVNHWRMVKGRLAEEAVKDSSSPAGHHTAVWYAAEKLAAQQSRAVTPDDLRHACNVYALGRDISHTALSNSQFDRLLLLWGLLIDPFDVAAQMAWDHPDQARKESLIHSIESSALQLLGSATAGEAYIRAMTADWWHTIEWRDLDTDKLLGLLRNLKGKLQA